MNLRVFNQRNQEINNNKQVNIISYPIANNVNNQQYQQNKKSTYHKNQPFMRMSSSLINVNQHFTDDKNANTYEDYCNLCRNTRQQLTTLRQRYDQLVIDYDLQRQKMRQNINNQQYQQHQLSVFSKRNTQLQRRINDLQQQLKAAKIHNDQLFQQLQVSQNVVRTTVNQHQNNQQKNADFYRSSLRQLEHQNRQLLYRIQQYESSIFYKNTQIQRYKSESQGKQIQILSLRRQIQTYLNKQKVYQDDQKLLQKYMTQNSKIFGLKQSIQNLTSQNKQLKTQIKQFNIQLKNLKAKNKNIQTQKQNIENEKLEISQKYEAAQKHSKELSQKIKSKQMIQNYITKLTQDKNNYQPTNFHQVQTTYIGDDTYNSNRNPVHRQSYINQDKYQHPHRRIWNQDNQNNQNRSINYHNQNNQSINYDHQYNQSINYDHQNRTTSQDKSSAMQDINRQLYRRLQNRGQNNPYSHIQTGRKTSPNQRQLNNLSTNLIQYFRNSSPQNSFRQPHIINRTFPIRNQIPSNEIKEVIYESFSNLPKQSQKSKGQDLPILYGNSFINQNESYTQQNRSFNQNKQRHDRIDQSSSLQKLQKKILNLATQNQQLKTFLTIKSQKPQI